MAHVLDKKAVTIQDVARQANVSTATVSRALSAPNSVSAKKRDAVLAAVESTGYRVNRAARSLRTQRSNTVLALLPTLGNPFFSQVLQGIVDVLTPAGQALIVAETDQINNAGDDLISYFEDQRADGVIVLDGALSPSSLARLHNSSHGSRVVFACEWPASGGFPSVRSANADGARKAVEHLYDLGHRFIAHVAGPEGNVLTPARRDGFLEACAERHVATLCMAGDFSLDAGINAAAEILAMENRPTAVFCASDVIAFGLISGLTRAGVSVPEDISIIGFDDIEYSEHFIPPLASIRQDRVALGQAAARMLLDRYGSDSGAPVEEIRKLPVEFIARASTAAPR
ncbi:MAG: LacI family DNA-binding transcriptional regulator [Pseudomonadota bacterium]